jgi:high-affinity Fe2+/Pb2+ permease
MNNQQINKYNMYLTVQGTLSDYAQAWTNIPVVTKIKNRLDELIAQLGEQNEVKQISTKASTNNKNQLKEQLIKKAAILGGVLVSFASIENDAGLAIKAKVSKSELERLRETTLPDTIQVFIDEAQNRLTQLADYGYTEAQLTELGTTLDDFRVLSGSPRKAQTKISAAVATLEDLFSQVDEVLKNQMDKLMLQFKETQTEFFQVYQKARVIVDR